MKFTKENNSNNRRKLLYWAAGVMSTLVFWRLAKKEEKEEKKPEKEQQDIYDVLREEIDSEKIVTDTPTDTFETLSDAKLTPYTNNVEYLSDHIDWISLRIRARNLKKVQSTFMILILVRIWKEI